MTTKKTLLFTLALAVVLSGCGDSSVFELEVGTCFNDEGASEEVASVPVVDCAEPHDNEIYYLFDLDGSSFPGEEAVVDLAYTGCYDRFESFVGRSYEESVLDFAPLYPTADGWTDLDDREVVCFVYDLDFKKLTGSMAGSGV